MWLRPLARVVDRLSEMREYKFVDGSEVSYDLLHEVERHEVAFDTLHFGQLLLVCLVE